MAPSVRVFVLVFTVSCLVHSSPVGGQSVDSGQPAALEEAVTSASQLREVVSDPNGQTSIRLPEAITLDETLLIDRPDISLLGAVEQGTHITCATSFEFPALIIRAGDVYLQSINFTDCTGASVVEVQPRQRVAVEATFSRVSFHNNGVLLREIRGGAVRAAPCRTATCLPVQLTFRSCTFVGNRAMQGGAVFAEDANLNIQFSNFSHNVADRSGGAVYSHDVEEREILVEDSRFENNTARGYAAVHRLNGSEILETPDPELRHAGMGGAIHAWSPHNMTVARSFFLKNVGYRGGGGLAVFAESIANDLSQASDVDPTFVLSVADSTFVQNAAYSEAQERGANVDRDWGRNHSGGGILCENLEGRVAEWTIEKCSFANNAAVYGGSVSMRAETLSNDIHRVRDCNFTEDTALMAAGSALFYRVRVEAANLNVSSARAVYAGGVMILGGMLNISADSRDPERLSVIKDCVAIIGGGLLVEQLGEVNLERVAIVNNRALHRQGGFGAFRSDGNLSLRGVVIANNTALIGGGIGVDASISLRITSCLGHRSVVRNNSAVVGGGLAFESGDSEFIFLTVRNTSFVANRALANDAPEMRGLVDEAATFRVTPTSTLHMPDLQDQLQGQRFIRFLTTIAEGNGGGIALNLHSLRLYTLAEIVFDNVRLTDNEARVGGGIAVYQTALYWNRADRTTDSCFPAQVGVESCQFFVAYNLIATGNKARYAGGLFATYPEGIRFSCGTQSHNVTIAELGIRTSPSDRDEICTYVYDNSLTVEDVGGEDAGAADAGSTATHLIVEGMHRQLRRVASGERLSAPCATNCTEGFSVAVKDALNQTIRRGIPDANLSLTMRSEDVSGDLRYAAENGIAVINRTLARGLNINSSITIMSERNQTISVVLNFSTRNCYPGELFHDNACRSCPDDQYGFDPLNGECESCEENAECAGGASLVPVMGYWHANPFSSNIRRCLRQAACDYEGRQERLTHFYQNGSQLSIYLQWFDAYLNGSRPDRPDFEDYQQCAEGHEGILCGSCQAGYGHSYTGSCEVCHQDRSMSRLSMLLAAVWLFFVIGVNCAITVLSTTSRVQLVQQELSRGLLQPPGSRDSRRQPIRYLSRSVVMRHLPACSVNGERGTPVDEDVYFRHLFTTMQTTETFKILMNYLQVTGAAVQLQANWGSILKTFLTAEEEGTSPPSITGQWLHLFMPWIVLLTIQLTFALGWILRFGFVKYKNLVHSLSHFTLENYTTRLIAISVVATYFSYIDVFRNILLAINCVEIEEAPLSTPSSNPYLQYATENGDRRVWTEDTEIKCFEGSHLPLGIVGIIGVVFSFGGIITIIVWLPLNKARVQERSFAARYWFLYQAYRDTWYTNAWESVILTRKALIVAVVVLSNQAGAVLQAALCVAVLTIAHASHAMFKPFKTLENHGYVPQYAGKIFAVLGLPSLAAGWVKLHNRVTLNTLESLSLVCSTTVFLSAIVQQDADSSGTGRTCMTTFSFVLNAFFVLYIVYRLYAGGHLLLDQKLSLNDPGREAQNAGMGLWNLFRKTLRVLREKMIQEEACYSERNGTVRGVEDV